MERAIAAVGTLSVVGTAHNGIAAIALIKQHSPDCALLDLSMPGANGLEVFQEARRWSPKTRFVIVTGISAASLFLKLYEAGVDGIFVKNAMPETITDGIERVINGERVMCPESLAAIERSRQNAALSDREIDVLRELAQGKNNKQIADVLNLSPKTIDSHRTRLLKKMKVNSTAALLVSAMRAGLLDT